MKKKLTPRQQRFVDAYDGNATRAARVAGYGSPTMQGYENLRKPHIKAAIDAREKKYIEKHILTREERQKFWTNVITGASFAGKKPTMNERLKASELLGRSQADFIEKIEHGGKIDGISVSFVKPDGDK
jgi:phage terminase small subunit